MVIRKLEKPLQLDEFLEKGGSVIEEKKPREWVNFDLRIRGDLLRSIELKLKSRVGLSRTAWILEAIQEKLKRE